MVNALSLADFERRNQLVGLLIQVASEFPSVFSSPPHNHLTKMSGYRVEYASSARAKCKG